MTREEAHQLVDAAFDFARSVAETGRSADVCRHVRAAGRETLLGFQALIGVALERTYRHPAADGEPSRARHVPID